uniref:Uncharacterized protein n=1 Tax=Bracon brevicornis TaxID=1563983 RepID=A0A6V7KRW8_9HYME
MRRSSILLKPHPLSCLQGHIFNQNWELITQQFQIISSSDGTIEKVWAYDLTVNNTTPHVQFPTMLMIDVLSPAWIFP